MAEGMGAWLSRVICVEKGDALDWQVLGAAPSLVREAESRASTANVGKTEGPLSGPAKLGCTSPRGLPHMFLFFFFFK